MSGSEPQPVSNHDPAGDGRGEDPTTQRLIAFLRSEGAAQARHGGRRTLLDHLIGTADIVRRWNLPPALQHAAVIHSVYGTDVYQRRLLPWSRRGALRAVAGEQAERLAYLFCVTPRDPLLAGTHLWTNHLNRASAGDASANAG